MTLFDFLPCFSFFFPQQRLAHTWKQPTPAPHDYGIPFEGDRMKRVRAGTRSVPAFDFAPARHQKKTSVDMAEDF